MKKLIALIIILLVAISSLYAVSEVDSLKKALSQVTIEERIPILNTLATKYWCVDPDSSVYFAERALELAQARNNKDPEVNIVRAVLGHIEYLKKRNKSSNIKWQIRVGIHTGDVIGGVVGIKNYIYDVFGDTINLASRMEQYSKPLKINISEDTYQYVKDSFSCIERDGIVVKGKGIIKMYFVEGVI